MRLSPADKDKLLLATAGTVARNRRARGVTRPHTIDEHLDYDDAATVASAALKLLGLDPAESARLIAELAPEIDAAARAIGTDERSIGEQEPPAAGGLELAASVHAERTERFFAS